MPLRWVSGRDMQPRGKLYCDNRFCIAIIEIVLQPRQLGWAGSVLQYTGLYCRLGGLRLA